jgi:hypothetical protein
MNVKHIQILAEAENDLYEGQAFYSAVGWAERKEAHRYLSNKPSSGEHYANIKKITNTACSSGFICN